MKKTRRLSTKESDDLKDISSYWSKLDEAAQAWLQTHYIEPEILQKVGHLPQAERRRIWKESKRTKRCVGGMPNQCLYLADMETLFSASSIEDSLATNAEVKEFFDQLKKVP